MMKYLKKIRSSLRNEILISDVIKFEFGGGIDDENRKPYVGSNRY